MSANNNIQPIGRVVGGSLSKNLQIRLEPSTSVEDITVGTYLTISGSKARILGIVVDISIGFTDSNVESNSLNLSNPLVSKIVNETVIFGSLTVKPMVILPEIKGAAEDISPAKTITEYYAPVYFTTDDDIALVFGSEDQKHFSLGTPLDMETKVCLDLEKFVTRSNGIFGKSGTGKTFLTRLLLIGILQKNVASCLVFDMHNEYGWRGKTEKGKEVKGLKPLFPSQVVIFTLDNESLRRRGTTADWTIKIGYDEIEPDDIKLLADTLKLSDIAVGYCELLKREWKKSWIKNLLDPEYQPILDELSKNLGMNTQALSSLKNRLQQIKRFDFLTEEKGNDFVSQVLNYSDRGMHIVLEFGKYQNNLTAYMLVSNILTRRLHSHYVRKNEEMENTGGTKPHPLVIVLEEAHKFLAPQISSHSIFGMIAREDRKYNITLLVNDQRPSSIDQEIMSQIGTKLSCALDNERDIDAILSGTADSRDLRIILSRVSPKQQTLITGHSVPIPVVIKTREYGDNNSYKDLLKNNSFDSSKKPLDISKEIEEDLEDLF